MDLSNAINDDGDTAAVEIENEQDFEKRERQEMLEHVLFNDYQAMSTKNSAKVNNARG